MSPSWTQRGIQQEENSPRPLAGDVAADFPYPNPLTRIAAFGHVVLACFTSLVRYFPLINVETVTVVWHQGHAWIRRVCCVFLRQRCRCEDVIVDQILSATVAYSP